MHVAINALFLEPPMGGVETYLRELCRGLLNAGLERLTVLVTPAGHEALAQDDWAAQATLHPHPVLGRQGVRAAAELMALGVVADRLDADVVHSVAMTGPLASRAARVVTIPDTIWITNPEDTMTHRLWRTVVPRVAGRATRVVAISEAAGDEIVRHLGVDRGRMDVVPLGYRAPDLADVRSEQDVRAELGLAMDAPVVLNVGQKKPHRNLERLVRAMVAVRAEVPGATLVLPGPPNPAGEQRLRDTAAACGLPPEAIVIPGYLSRETVDGLYACCAAFVLPSLVEGFGLPVLEAMARSAPVACSGDSAPGEIAGDAGLLFDPTSERAIADAIIRLLTDLDLAADYRRRGPERAAQYTWERCAEGTLASYAAALAGRESARPGA